MSDKLTAIRLPQHCGIAEWGVLSKSEAIAKVRAWAEHQRNEADKYLAAKDEDFEIEVVNGAHVQRHVSWVQKPAKVCGTCGGKGWEYSPLENAKVDCPTCNGTGEVK